MSKKIGRNDPCPCGSGKKYKNCCMQKQNKMSFTDTLFSDAKYLEMFEKEFEWVLSNDERHKKRLMKINAELDSFIFEELKGLRVETGRFNDYAKSAYMEDINSLPSYFTNSSLIAEDEFINHEYNRHGGMNSLFLLYLLCGHIAFTLNEIAEGKVKPSSKQTIEISYYRAKKALLVDFLNKQELYSKRIKAVIDERHNKYLDDDIKELDPDAIKNRFFTAVQTGQKSTALKLFGMMRELDPGEDYYYAAMAHFINKEFEDVIRFVDKVSRDDKAYLSAIFLKLEVLAILGEMDEFFICLKSNMGMSFDLWHLRLLLMTLFLNAPEEKFESRGGCFSAYFKEKAESIFNNYKYEDSHNHFYQGKVLRLIAKMVVEGLTIIEQIAEIPEEIAGSVAAQKSISQLLAKLDRLKATLMYFAPDNEIHTLLDSTIVEDHKKIVDQKEHALKLIYQIIDSNPEQWFIDTKIALEATLKLGDSAGYVRSINDNCSDIIKEARNGNKDAEELLRVAYIESIVNEDEAVDARITDFLAQIKESVKLESDITDRIIRGFLSPQGNLAYDAVELQYRNSLEEEYGWKDAGLISFGYYRILELEMNLKLAIPLFKAAGSAEELIEINKENKEKVPDDPNNRKYKNLWSKNISIYSNLENSDFKGKRFMLGDLNCLFNLTGSGYHDDDIVAKKVLEALPQVLPEYGIEKYNDGFFEQITNEETRNKFRNPPAHAQYLPYDTACECRELFRNTVLEFTQIFK